MGVLIGTSDGLLIVDESGARSSAADLSGRTIRALVAANGHVFAGADDGVYLTGWAEVLFEGDWLRPPPR